MQPIEMMQPIEIWKSKELKNSFLKILGKNPNGTIAVTFEMNNMTPTNIHNYQQWYLEQYYESTGDTQVWVLDPTLKQL